MLTCPKCSHKYEGNFCPECGQEYKPERINGRYALREVGQVFNVHKGFFYTIKELFIRPGKNINEYLHDDRTKLVKPIMFVVICSLIYTLVLGIFHFEDGYMAFHGDSSISNRLFQWINQNYGYANLLMGIFIALWVKLLYRKYDYNIYELLIMLCYIMGIGMLIMTLGGIAESLTYLKFLQWFVWIFLIYVSWALADFHDRKVIWNYIKGFIAYYLGMFSFILIMIIIGKLLDWIF